MTVIADLQQMDSYPITIWQGKSWSLELDYTQDDGTTAIDLTSYTVKAQIRWAPRSALIADMGVSVDAVHGKLTLSLTPTQTDAVLRNAVYDVELISGSQKIGLLRGPVSVVQAVTV